jgi:hypothetical protein
MRRGVAFSMQVFVSLGRYQLKLCGDILYDAGVGMFINHDRGGGMRHEDMANAALHAAGLHDISDPAGDILELLPGVSIEIYLVNHVPLLRRYF